MHVEAPRHGEIARLGVQLNATCVAAKRREAAKHSGEKMLDQALVEAIRVEVSPKSFRFNVGA